MKYLSVLFLFLSNCLLAQTKIAGTYDTKTQKFTPEDKNYNIQYFIKGYASVSDGKSSGIIDSTGTVIVPLIYDMTVSGFRKIINNANGNWRFEETGTSAFKT